MGQLQANVLEKGGAGSALGGGFGRAADSRWGPSAGSRPSFIPSFLPSGRGPGRPSRRQPAGAGSNRRSAFPSLGSHSPAGGGRGGREARRGSGGSARRGEARRGSGVRSGGGTQRGPPRPRRGFPAPASAPVLGGGTPPGKAHTEATTPLLSSPLRSSPPVPSLLRAGRS